MQISKPLSNSKLSKSNTYCLIVEQPILVLILLTITTTPYLIHSSDPDILTDFIIPPQTPINATFFTFTGFRPLIGDQTPPTFRVYKATINEFPALNGQSVSTAVLEFPSGAVNPPHSHPRSAELLFVVRGSLEVGLIDTTNKLYTQTLQMGDMFVFPKGLVHYQYNADANESASAISAFGSANAGTVSVPGSVFGSGIDDDILAKGFKTDVATIQKIRAGLAVKP